MPNLDYVLVGEVVEKIGEVLQKEINRKELDPKEFEEKVRLYSRKVLDCFGEEPFYLMFIALHATLIALAKDFVTEVASLRQQSSLTGVDDKEE